MYDPRVGDLRVFKTFTTVSGYESISFVHWRGPEEAFLRDFRVIERGGEISDPYWTDPLEDWTPEHPDWEFVEYNDYEVRFVVERLQPDGTWKKVPHSRRSAASEGYLRRATVHVCELDRSSYDDSYFLPQFSAENWDDPRVREGVEIVRDTRRVRTRV